MSRNTRQEILNTAKALFNARGYNAVTLRDIAGSLGISKGNLTYHFKKKEDIMEALLATAHNTRPTTAPRTLEELDAFFLDLQRAVAENAYYFQHYTQLAQTIPAIRDTQQDMYTSNVDLLREAFSNLHEDGLLRGELFGGEYACILDALHLSGIYWNSFRQLKQASGSTATYRQHAWGLMGGLLTEKGRKLCETVVSV